jgi:transposase InsO family protein
LTCIDPFTKWAEAFPIRNKEAETVAKVLVEQVFCRFGVPIAMLSDQGKEVDGNLMREICRLLEIDKLRTTPYKASTNAAIERFHRSLNSMLGKVIKESQTDWDERLPFVMAAYRASRHDSTGFSPNALTLGREVKAPVDLVLNPPSAEEPLEVYDDYVERLRDRIKSAYTLVREELGRAAERNRKYYDLRVRPQHYSVGQWVYYYNPRHYRGRQDKWSRKYGGPMLITAVPSPVNVTLQKSRNSKPFTVHLDKVKPYLADPPQSWLPAPSEVTAAPNSPTAGAVPFVTLPAHNVESDEPDEQDFEETDYESQEPFEAEESPTQGLDDTMTYDFDMATDSDSTQSKSRELTLQEISERIDRLSEQLAREQYEVDDSPISSRRPARTHRLPSRYRD